MKIIGIEGSPRQNGNTEKLVKAVLEGAAGNGADTEFYKLSRMDITPCQGCRSCKKNDVCAVNDDMQTLYNAIQSADALVIGSPVYMWQVTAQTKAFMDRLMAFIAPDFSTRLKGSKRLLLAYTQGNPNIDMFNSYFDYMERLFGFLHFDVRGSLVVNQTRDKDDILDQPEALEKARQSGREMAKI